MNDPCFWVLNATCNRLLLETCAELVRTNLAVSPAWEPASQELYSTSVEELSPASYSLTQPLMSAPRVSDFPIMNFQPDMLA